MNDLFQVPVNVGNNGIGGAVDGFQGRFQFGKSLIL